ncbi:MAG: hypothetical protein R3D60_03395 [Paracoccaceae bacterium]
MTRLLFNALGAFAWSTVAAFADTPCETQSQMFVDALPGLASRAGLSTGADLVASDGRLMLASSVFAFSSCQLSTPGNCGPAPSLSRATWLNTLMLSGLLIECFKEDGGYTGERLALLGQFEQDAPTELRMQYVAQAASELGVTWEVAE